MKWSYGFDVIRVLEHGPFEKLWSLWVPNLVVDPLGVGFRYLPFGDNSIAPILVPDLKLLMFHSSNQDPRVIIPSEAEIPGRQKRWFKVSFQLFNSSNWLADIRGMPVSRLRPVNSSALSETSKNARQLRSNAQTQARLLLTNLSPPANAEDFLMSPRKIIGLGDTPLTGKGIKIAIIDSGFNIVGGRIEVKSENIANFSGNFGISESNGSHGTKALSVIAGMEYSIAPDADLYLARLPADSEAGLASKILALIWAAKRCVHIISISQEMQRDKENGAILGTPAALQRAIDFCHDHGCQIVAGVANLTNASCSALAIDPRVIAVGAMVSESGLLVDEFKNDALARVDCVSVGYMVRASDDLSTSIPVEFGHASAATPLVAGCLALYMEKIQRVGLDVKEEFLQVCCQPRPLPHAPGWGRGVVKFPF